MVMEHVGSIFKGTTANSLRCSKINPFFHFSKPFSRLSIIETFCQFTRVNKVFTVSIDATLSINLNCIAQI